MISPLISVAELKRQLNPSTVIFDCRFSLADANQGEELYRRDHLPGAYYLSLDHDLSSPPQQHGGRHPLPNIGQLVEKLRSCGVSKHTLVVVYDDSRFGFAARAWWLLHYLGHTNVAVLDGGYRAWCAGNNPLDRRLAQPKQGIFKARENSSMLASRPQVEQFVANHSATLIDSREEKRFLGIEEPIDPVAGHIPGALNYPWQGVTNEQGFAKSDLAQKDRWQNLSKQQDIIVYCGSGVTACTNLLSLEIAGLSAKLYPGSWSDWCSYPHLEHNH